MKITKGLEVKLLRGRRSKKLFFVISIRLFPGSRCSCVQMIPGNHSNNIHLVKKFKEHVESQRNIKVMI